MSNEEITMNELRNDGSMVHLYFEARINAWTTYGHSAYALRLYAKANGYSNLRGYSKPMQQPCTVVCEEALIGMSQQAVSMEKLSATYVLLHMPDRIDQTAYAKWTSKLRQSPQSDDELQISTPISKYVPRDRFIPDGMTTLARYFKRMSDFVLATLALLVFSPLFLFCYIAVRREDGGPAIFRQERIGRFGRPFYIYKFRSMRLDAEQFGPQLSHSGGDDDPRLTKIGRFLRAHHLDELPQLWNVFCGDMAFIGPRPERRFYIDQIVEHDPRYLYLYQIRPGVTSYATLYNGYTDTMEKMLRRLEYDLYYLGHRSWWFDMKILFNTFAAIVFGKKF